jgi:hypothetical protein
MPVDVDASRTRDEGENKDEKRALQNEEQLLISLQQRRNVGLGDTHAL